jgi:hypothetical protein
MNYAFAQRVKSDRSILGIECGAKVKQRSTVYLSAVDKSPKVIGNLL